MGYIIVSIENLHQFNPCRLTEAMIDMLDVLFSVDSLETIESRSYPPEIEPIH